MEPLFFNSCAEVDSYFREGREFFNETFVKKLAQTSAWFTRVSEKTWPMNSGTTQRGFRFGRGYFDPTKPWRKVVSERCEQNSCDSQPERVMRPGTDSYFWELMTKELETEWFCVEDLMYRLLPVEEVDHIQATLAIITRTVHEEYSRATFVGASNHKWGILVDEDGTLCTDADDTFWFMNEFTGVGETSWDTRYVYVKCAPANLSKLACLSLEFLDEALVDLGDEEDSYRLDMREQGIEKLDIIVPDERVARRIWFASKSSSGWDNAENGFDDKLSMLRLGVDRIIGDYAFGYDKTALRYNADSVYNSASTGGGPAGTGLAAFDENDITTWARLIRVPRYEEVPAEIGYKYIPFSKYKRADFGISMAWMPTAMQKWRNPSWTGTGDVKMDPRNYAGEWGWRRPDWECNRKRKQGFFEAEFKLAMQVADPTIMHSFLHRIDYTRAFVGTACPIQTYTAPAPIDTYVCQGVNNNNGVND